LIVKQMKNEQTPRSAPEIWAITDSRPGNAVQARALAEAVARRAGGVAVDKPIALRRPFDLIPAALWAAIPPREGGWPFSGSPMAARGSPRPGLRRPSAAGVALRPSSPPSDG
jgi:hypothetical protein